MPLLRPNASRPAPVRVERIATTPICCPQRDQAVTALAVLITAWQHGTAAESLRGSCESASASRPRRATLTTRHDARADHQNAEGRP